MRNRRILAVLLVVPLLAFATSSMIGNGGRITKKKNIDPSERTIQKGDVETDKIVDEMVATMELFQSEDNEYEQSERAYMWDERISEDLKKFVEKNVVKVLEKKKLHPIDGKNSFSRCPSGYRACIIVSNEKITNEGWMVYDSGCWDQPLTKFRYDIEKNTVEAYIGSKTGYVSMDEFFPIFKQAQMKMAQKS